MLPKDNVYFTIPTLVIHWILLYFYVDEKFKEYNDIKYKLSDDNMTITKIGGGDSTCYGNVKIQSDNGGIHKWLFKVIRCDRYMAIGIDETIYFRKDEGSLNNRISDTKVYHIWNDGEARSWDDETRRRSKNYSLSFTKDDQVLMILDLNAHTLAYSINNGETKVTHKNVMTGKDITYCMAVCLQTTNDEVTLLKYG